MMCHSGNIVNFLLQHPNDTNRQCEFDRYTFFGGIRKHGNWPRPVAPIASTPKGILGEPVQPMGSITLPVKVRIDTCKATTMTDFLVVKTHSSYNVIIVRLTLNNPKAMTSTYHLKMKFSTEEGVGEVCDEQVLARECYVQELKEGRKEVHMVEPLATKPQPCPHPLNS